MDLCQFYYPRPFWPTGIAIACVCVCVYLCVCQLLLVRAITHHTFQLESPDFNKKMQNILVKGPIVLGADWAWPSMSNLTSFQNYVYLHRFCVFEIFVTRAKTEFVELFHIVYGAAHILIPWDHRSPASPRLGDWQWILLAAVGFRQIIRNSHIDILYYNIGNHRNNCKTAVICLYLFGLSHSPTSPILSAVVNTRVFWSVSHPN